jgi:hypothetical protein
MMLPPDGACLETGHYTFAFKATLVCLFDNCGKAINWLRWSETIHSVQEESQ